MNRKLLNGLLVAAIAAGGVGTFTSCKDENFGNEVLLQQDALAVQIQAIRNVNDAKFKAALENWLNTWTDDITGQGQGFQSYEDMVKAAQAMSNLYDEIMAGKLPAGLLPFASTLMNWMWDNGLKSDVQSTIESYGYQTKDQVDAAIIEKLQGYVTESQMTTAIQDALKGYVTLTDVQNMLSGYATTGDLDAFRTEWLNKLNGYATTGDLKNLEKQLMDLINALEFKAFTHPSSVEISRVFNPVFGSINLPVGINSTVLATYIYSGTDANFDFPTEAFLHLAEASPYSPVVNDPIFKVIYEMAPVEALKSGDFTVATDDSFGNMGGAVLAINPLKNDFLNKYKVELVKSNGNNPFSTEDESLCLVPFKDELYFGASRANESTDLYALKVNATSDNYNNLIFDLDKSELKDAFKSLADSKSISSVAHLGEVVFKAVNNKLPAYAVKVSWNEGTEEAPVWNAVYSPFDLAATVLHPLSYGTMISAAIPSGKSLPYISPLEDYIEKIQKKITLDIEDVSGVDPIDPFELQISLTTGPDGKTYVWFKWYNSETGEYETLPLEYNLNSIIANTPEAQAALEEFVNQILKAAGHELAGDFNKQVVEDLNQSIADINKQLQNYNGKVGEINDYLDRIKESKKLTYADKLVDIYNKLVGYANRFLDNPDHYLQVAMAYSAGNGPHHMAPDPLYPTVVDGSKGTGFEVFVTSHTGDIIVPSYKKYVGITGIVKENGEVDSANLAALNAQAGLNRIYEGTQERIAFNITPLRGKVVRLTYVSVDYRGMCSMENYYLAVL